MEWLTKRFEKIENNKHNAIIDINKQTNNLPLGGNEVELDVDRPGGSELFRA